MEGSSFRRIVLPEPVDGALTNAAYGNGVLVLSMPKAGSGGPGTRAGFKIQVIQATRGHRPAAPAATSAR